MLLVFKRFLKPSQVPGIDTEAFMRQQQLASNLHEQSILGYRGLVGELNLLFFSSFVSFFQYGSPQTDIYGIIYLYLRIIIIIYHFIIIQTIDCRYCKDFSHTVHSLISKRCSFILPKIA